MFPINDKSKSIFFIVLWAITLLSFTTSRAGSPLVTQIDPGVDVLYVDEAADDIADLLANPSFFTGVAPIGSSVIPLQGVPFGLGNTDTILQRPAPFDRLEFPEIGTTHVPIQLVELHLQSVQPFQVNVQGDVQEWMLDVQLTPDPAPGVLDLQITEPNGGFFNAVIPVMPELIFTRIDTGDAPAVVQILTGADLGLSNLSINGVWSYIPPLGIDPLLLLPGALDPLTPLGSNPDFFLGVNPGTQGLELMLQSVVTYENRSPSAPELGASSIIDPVPLATTINFGLASATTNVPLPATLFLLMLGIAMLYYRLAYNVACRIARPDS